MAVSISISITQNSQSVANNTSNVTVKVTAKWTGGSYNATGLCTGSLTIDGTKYSFSGITFNTSQTTSGSKVIMTKTVNVSHNTNGSKTLSCSASFVTRVSSGTVSASASKTLTTILRKSTLSVSTGILGTSQTLTITRQSTSFTHSIKAVCGSSTVYIKANGSTQSSEIKHTDCSIPFEPPITWASQNTTGASVSVTFTITTYSGSTNIGSAAQTVKMLIPPSVAPSCDVTVSDPTGVFDIYDSFVKGLSKFQVTVAPKLSYNSPITTYRTTANGDTYTSASFTTAFLQSSGSLSITAKVTDRRGRSGSKTVTKTVLDYNPPILTELSVRRCNEDGTNNEQGDFILVNFAAEVTDLSNINTATYSLRYKKSSDTEYTSVELGDYTNVYSVTDGSYIFSADSGSSYDIEFAVSDRHITTKRTSTASTGFVLMHWNAEGNAMGIGKVAELEHVLDIGMQTRFFNGILHPVLEPETDLNDVRTPNTYVGANVSNYAYVNCPLTSGTFTLEVVGAGDAGQVKQSIQTCSKAQSKTYERYYYSGSWGEWVCVSDFDGALLWEGSYYMRASQTITLPEAISKQRSGIVLVFSRYSSSTAQNYHFNTFFVPKYQVANHSGCGHTFMMTTDGTFGVFASKYLYIHDTSIVGNDNNTATGTGSCGITYANNGFVLRYVIGV